MLEMPFRDRIKAARVKKGLSKAELARKVGRTRQAVTQWETKGTTPPPELMAQLSIILDVQHLWLSTGRGTRSVLMSVVGLENRGEIAAGVWLEIPESQDMEYERVPVAPDPRYVVESQYALRIRGHSVNRVAKDGATIVCVDVLTAGIEVKDGDLVIVERRRGALVETTIKRVRKAKGGLELWPESDDPSHQEKLTLVHRRGEAEVAIKALVVGVYNPVPRGT